MKRTITPISITDHLRFREIVCRWSLKYTKFILILILLVTKLGQQTTCFCLMTVSVQQSL